MEEDWEILSGGSVESWEDLGANMDDFKDYKSPVDLLNAMTDKYALVDEHSEGLSSLRASSPPESEHEALHPGEEDKALETMLGDVEEKLTFELYWKSLMCPARSSLAAVGPPEETEHIDELPVPKISSALLHTEPARPRPCCAPLRLTLPRHSQPMLRAPLTMSAPPRSIIPTGVVRMNRLHAKTAPTIPCPIAPSTLPTSPTPLFLEYPPRPLLLEYKKTSDADVDLQDTASDAVQPHKSSLSAPYLAPSLPPCLLPPLVLPSSSPVLTTQMPSLTSYAAPTSTHPLLSEAVARVILRALAAPPGLRLAPQYIAVPYALPEVCLLQPVRVHPCAADCSLAAPPRPLASTGHLRLLPLPATPPPALLQGAGVAVQLARAKLQGYPARLPQGLHRTAALAHGDAFQLMPRTPRHLAPGGGGRELMRASYTFVVVVDAGVKWRLETRVRARFFQVTVSPGAGEPPDSSIVQITELQPPSPPLASRPRNKRGQLLLGWRQDQLSPSDQTPRRVLVIGSNRRLRAGRERVWASETFASLLLKAGRTYPREQCIAFDELFASKAGLALPGIPGKDCFLLDLGLMVAGAHPRQSSKTMGPSGVSSKWRTVIGGISGQLPAGNTLAAAPTADTPLPIGRCAPISQSRGRGRGGRGCSTNHKVASANKGRARRGFSQDPLGSVVARSRIRSGANQSGGAVAGMAASSNMGFFLENFCGWWRSMAHRMEVEEEAEVAEEGEGSHAQPQVAVAVTG